MHVMCMTRPSLTPSLPLAGTATAHQLGGSGAPGPELQASLDLSSRANSVLQERLHESLARLDGELAELAGRAQRQRQQQPTAGMLPFAAAAAAAAAPDGSEAAGQAEAHVQAVAEQAATPQSAGVHHGPLRASALPTPPQLPLQWRAPQRSLVAAFEAAAGPAAPLPTPAPAAAGTAPLDAAVHITVANVGQPCPLPKLGLPMAVQAGVTAAGATWPQGPAVPPAVQSNGSLSGGRQQAPLLPPLSVDHRWAGAGRGSGRAAPVLHTAARAAACMQPLQPAAAPAYAAWWQQQQASWPAWQQAQRWQRFPPGWQQYSQPVAQQQWGSPPVQYGAGWLMRH